MTRRVVVTGMGGLCPLGEGWPAVREGLLACRSGISRQPDWDGVAGLKTRLGAAADFQRPAHYPRKKARTMGRVALLAARAVELALTEAGLLRDGVIDAPECGIAFGSTSGAPPFIERYAERITVNRTLSGVNVSDYIKFMSHSPAANLAQFFGVRGRVIPACSAGASGALAIGLAYENIKHGKQDVMIAGGAEELALYSAVVFDLLGVASTRNDAPERTPRPFDVARDGLVTAEGAAAFILESRERARARGANILAEVVGFGTRNDGAGFWSPSIAGLRDAMRLALADAGLHPDRIDAVNAHGAAVEAWDIAETQAVREVFGRPVPIGSLKGSLGHALGAAGALESWISIMAMAEGWLAPTRGLQTVDTRCAPLDYVKAARETSVRCLMSNSYGLGGAAASLIFKRP